MTAPIALFVYNRPWHTRQTLQALAGNELAAESDLLVFSDGPRSSSDEQAVSEVRALFDRLSGFRTVQVSCRTTNAGLANSIIEGVTRTVADHGRVIVVEDDLVTSRFFLRFLNDGLDRYETEDRVISIHGYNYPVRGLPASCFIRGADCWGWATWKRGWDLFEQDGRDLLARLTQQGLVDRFDMNGAFPYVRMLRAQIAGRNDSWAIRWYASALLADRLTLYPGHSLVHNIGNDGSGAHGDASDAYGQQVADAPITTFPDKIEEDTGALEVMSQWLRRNQPTLAGRVLARLRRLLAQAKS